MFLFKWKGTIGATWFTVVTTATLLVYLMPQGYVASSSVLVERTKAPSSRTESYPGLEMAEVINTEAAVISSRTVMQHVVDRLTLHERPRSETPLSRVITGINERLISAGLLDAIDRREKWIASLIKRVKVKPKVDSNVLTIQYQHDDPALAADIINAVTDEYIAHHIRIYSYEGVAAFYRQQMGESDARLTRLRAELEAYKTGASWSAADARKTGLVREMDSLRDRITSLNFELAESLPKYDDQHPHVKLLRAKVDSTENRIAQIKTQLGELDRTGSKVIEMEAVVKAQEESYLADKRQFEHATLSAAGDRSLVNLRVVDYATVPARPSFPRLFYIVVALFGGALLSLTIAMIGEYFDHRVTTPEMAEQVLGVPVIGSVARYPSRTRRLVWHR